MPSCPKCSRDFEPTSRYCPSCGAALASGAGGDETLLTEPTSSSNRASSSAPSSTPSAAWLHSHSSPDSRFAPGSLLGGRFRIIGLLGRGGMGDVYRADDLLLGQPVALKFLPPELAQHPDRLARFYGEVRIARQVSHPNVCRVYDVGEVDGLPYMSMEMVDGDDLASLLRRIGRLPEDKALEVGRQMCAGLAAAHEKGVLHRDLKPANILIDAHGKVRITDFGLAVLADEFKPAEARAGTPAYMAPEQLSRNEVTVQSDVYSLGVVLYEMFTGRRAYSGRTLVEVQREHQSSVLPNPSKVLEDIDPAVERAILRCLEPDPRERPSSALAVAASLPGGDPLAAALAAGELPSPDLVAAAGGTGVLRRRVAWSALGIVVAGLAVLLALSGRLLLLRQVPLDKPPAVLADRAASILRTLGYSDPPGDRASGFVYNTDYLRWVRDNDRSRERWRDLSTGRPAGIEFWYRQHTHHMSSLNPMDGPGVSLVDPPLLDSGMASVLLDPLGRLTELYIVPPQFDSTLAVPAAADWAPLFAAAGLDPSRFTPVAPSWVPPVYSDARAAWAETAPARAGAPVRIEAGSYGGKPNYFQMIGPWTRPNRMTPRPQQLREKLAERGGIALILALLVGSVLLARRSLKTGQGDRRGATRLGFYVCIMTLAAWLFAENHASNPNVEWVALVPYLGLAIFLASIYGVLYLGLEPVVRRRWPDSLISWNRLLAGRFTDPRVGRDLLLGLAAGAVMAGIEAAQHLLPGLLGLPPVEPVRILLDSLDGFAHSAALFFNVQSDIIFLPMAVLLLLILFRMLLRNPYVAAAVPVVLLALLSSSGNEYPWIALVANTLQMCILLGVLLRLGLFAAIATNFFMGIAGTYYPFTSDTAAWYAPATAFAGGVLLLLAIYGFRTSLAGKPLVGGRASAI